MHGHVQIPFCVGVARHAGMQAATTITPVHVRAARTARLLYHTLLVYQFIPDQIINSGQPAKNRMGFCLSVVMYPQCPRTVQRKLLHGYASIHPLVIYTNCLHPCNANRAANPLYVHNTEARQHRQTNTHTHTPSVCARLYFNMLR